MKPLKLVLAIVLSLVLFMGLALPVMAQPDKPPKPTVTPAIQVLSGNVTQIDPGKTFFYLQQKDKPPIKITVDGNTRYFIVRTPIKVNALPPNTRGLQAQLPKAAPVKPVTPPGKPTVIPGPMAGATAAVAPVPAGGQKASFNDLSIGDRVSVRVATGTTLAKQVFIYEPPFARVNGTILAVSTTDNTTTIQPVQGGNPLTVKWNQNTKVTIRGAIAVVPGQFAQVVYRVKNKVAQTINVLPRRPVPPPPPASGNVTGSRPVS